MQILGPAILISAAFFPFSFTSADFWLLLVADSDSTRNEELISGYPTFSFSFSFFFFYIPQSMKEKISLENN